MNSFLQLLYGIEPLRTRLIAQQMEKSGAGAMASFKLSIY